MKTTTNHLHFYCQMGAVGTLATIGLMALCGEPDEALTMAAWLRVFGCQVATTAVCWISAWRLYKHWNLGDKMERIEKLNR